MNSNWLTCCETSQWNFMKLHERERRVLSARHEVRAKISNFCAKLGLALSLVIKNWSFTVKLHETSWERNTAMRHRRGEGREVTVLQGFNTYRKTKKDKARQKRAVMKFHCSFTGNFRIWWWWRLLLYALETKARRTGRSICYRIYKAHTQAR